ncbi:MAG TPA: type II toxin-antitoxin system RatA family toxin [Burkholderiaceae bacterium]|nr:type II toxin-antitoxin system RatA family toxin [Burkholderiaceae bacterium]
MAFVHKTALVPYPAAAIYALVERVEDYPAFLPWCGGTTVHSRTGDTAVVTVQIDFRGLRQSFTTENFHRYPERIEMKLVQGPFRRLDGQWLFVPLRADACKVEFRLDYEFAGPLISRILGPVFDQLAATFVDAFVRRAEELHA